ncbi:endonuclease/exonuclease/phosphatase family protein [Amycolatopsis sp. NPDC058986]|uniref:endonuclease/exonuclease/phosphatase family protein n=1 Tax=unclassified Amycolatopsis TaxID=2618356 RepID=UPI00367146D1
MLKFGSYNLLNYTAAATDDLSEDGERQRRVEAVIRELDVDVLAVQEVIVPDHLDVDERATTAAARLRTLADRVGMTCILPDGTAAVGLGNHRFCVALLWRSGITPVGVGRVYSGVNAWHSILTQALDVGAAQPVVFGSYHATPFGQYRRADEAERVVSTLTRSGSPGVIGGDWNGISADRILRSRWLGEHDGDTDAWVLYDVDPYVQPGIRWHSDFVYQCTWDYDEDGRRHWQADRRPGEILAAGGLRDAAAVLNVTPWQPTTGHWRGDAADPYPQRRIDRVHCTADVVSALRGYEVGDTELARTASDHLPVVVDLDPAAITRSTR